MHVVNNSSWDESLRCEVKIRLCIFRWVHVLHAVGSAPLVIYASTINLTCRRRLS